MHLLFAFLQAVAQGLSDPQLLEKGLELFIGGLVAWVAKDIRSMKKTVGSMNTTLLQWRVHFFGLDNNGGLNSRVDKLEARAYGWDKQLGDHENRLITLDRNEEDNPNHNHRRRDD